MAATTDTEVVEPTHPAQAPAKPAGMPDELYDALTRLRWVVPGRDYGDRMIADVVTVLGHFGMCNADGTYAARVDHCTHGPSDANS